MSTPYENRGFLAAIQTCAALGDRACAFRARRGKLDRLVRRWLDHVDWEPQWVLEHPQAHRWLQNQLRDWW